jgi:serine/threonine protein kinase
MTGLSPGSVVGAYRVEAVVGRGTTGIVYRASSGVESVALKVLRPELAIDEMYRRRFLREVRIAQELRHPHLVEVLEAGIDGGTVYLVARYVPGRSLARLLVEDGPLPMPQLVRTALGVASGLDELHRQGIVHRDVKPSNILIDAQGRAMLTDFGLARHVAETVLTSYGLVLGTLDYIAPERLAGGAATPASDVYSLGCVVYACLTGHAPFAGRSIDRVMDAHRSEEPEDPIGARCNAPPALGWAVLRALAKDPSLRPGTASAYARIVRAGAFESDG